MNDLERSVISDEKLQKKLAYWNEYLAPGYRERPLGVEEILKNTFEHIDASQVRAVLLRGSRATGRQNPLSDVDLLVLMKTKYRTADVYRDPDGVRYNLQMYSDEEISDKTVKSICRGYYGTKPIYDPDGAGRHLTDRLDAAEREACEQIPKGNTESRDYLLKLAALMDLTDPDTALYVRAKILCEFPAYIAAFNGFNLTGYKHTIDCLLRDDRELALLYAESLKPGLGRLEIENLINRAFRAPCGLNVLDTDFSHSNHAFDIRIGDSNMYLLYQRYSRFMDMLHLFTPHEMETYDYFMTCRDTYPGLFRELKRLLELD